MNTYPSSNTELIIKEKEQNISSGIKSINNNLNKNLSRIQSDITSLSEKYKGLRNQLSLNNEQQKRKTEEYIANTGNHTASGFAMSKRLDNTNAFNKEMNNINLTEQKERQALNDKIRDAYSDAEDKRNKLITDENSKYTERIISENARLDDFHEKQRINDANIEKMESDTELKKNKDIREQGEYELNMKYGEQFKQAELGKINSDINYTNAKTDTEISKKALTEAQIVKTNNSSSGKSYSSGGYKKEESGSDMNASKLAENINKQTGNPMYDAKGNLYYELVPLDAYTLLMEWKNKFNLSDSVVNDTAIYLGIQAML